MISNEAKGLVNKIRTNLPKHTDIYLTTEEKEVAVEILNILAARGCIIREATCILDYCKEVLKFCPVITFE